MRSTLKVNHYSDNMDYFHLDFFKNLFCFCFYLSVFCIRRWHHIFYILFWVWLAFTWVSLVAQMVNTPPVVQETRVWSLGWKDPLEQDMTTHSSTLAWKIPWTEKPCRLQSTGSQRVGHDWVTSLSLSLEQSYHKETYRIHINPVFLKIWPYSGVCYLLIS